MSYCPNCGKEISEESRFCQNCGKAFDCNRAYNNHQFVNEQSQYRPPYQAPYYAPQKNIVQLLSGKVKIQAAIWLVIACIQYILGVVFIIENIDLYLDEEIMGFVMGICLIAVAVANTVFAVKSFVYSADVLRNPVGVVSKYSTVSDIVITLIYNVLFGGIIGIAGSIYAFVIRNFVLINEGEFIKIEQQYNNARSSM